VDGIYERRWHPYNCRQQFRMARRNIFPRISTLAQIKNNLVGSFSDRLHTIERRRRFSSTKDFMNRLDEIAERYTSWKEGSFESDVGDGGKKVHRMWYKDTLAVLQEILGDVTLRDEMVWGPKKQFDGEGNRVFSEMWTANWWWDQQLELHPNEEVPENGSRTVVPLILSSDKTVFGSLSGEASAWPLYLSVGNIPSKYRWQLTRPYYRTIALLRDLTGTIVHEELVTD
jgi:Plavaka transposase